MGNILPVVSRNKDFQSVVPFPADSITNDEKSIKPKFGVVSNGSGLKINVSPAKSGKPSLGTPLTFEDIDNSITLNASEYDSSEFLMTEGQMRREGMISCENQCSQITKFVFVGGQKVAENLELLREKKITRIVNCSFAVTKNYFEHLGEFKYLTLNLMDGRQEDISWFACQVIQFIVEGCSKNHRILVHCEKGISRSCSLVIAYKMWSSGQKWKDAFDYVKLRRTICSPNTAFTCNLIEWGEILFGGAADATIAFRCSYHADYDVDTAVLKICRNLKSRRLLVPSTSMLNPNGVFVIRAFRDGGHFLYIWRGQNTSEDAFNAAHRLASYMQNIITLAEEIIHIRDGIEHEEFLRFLIQDGPFTTPSDDSSNFDDFFDFKPPPDHVRRIRNNIDEEIPAAYLPRLMHDLARESESGESLQSSRGSDDILDCSPLRSHLSDCKNLNIPEEPPENKLNGISLNLNIMVPVKAEMTSTVNPYPTKPATPQKTRLVLLTEDEGYSRVGSDDVKHHESDSGSIPLPGMLSRASSYKGGNEDEFPPKVSRAPSLKIGDATPPVSTSRVKSQENVQVPRTMVLNLQLSSLPNSQLQNIQVPSIAQDGMSIRKEVITATSLPRIDKSEDPATSTGNQDAAASVAPSKEVHSLLPSSTTSNDLMTISRSLEQSPPIMKDVNQKGNHVKPQISLLALPSKEPSSRLEIFSVDSTTDFSKDPFPALSVLPLESCRSSSSTSSNERPSSPVIVKNSSRKKVFPISELASPANSRPGSSERKLFGSPRIVPFIPLNTPTGSPHDQAVTQLQIGIAGEQKRPSSASSESGSARRDVPILLSLERVSSATQRPSSVALDSSRTNCTAASADSYSRRPSTPKEKSIKVLNEAFPSLQIQIGEELNRPSSSSSSSSDSHGKGRKEEVTTMQTVCGEYRVHSEVPRLTIPVSPESSRLTVTSTSNIASAPHHETGSRRQSVAVNFPPGGSAEIVSISVSSRPSTPSNSSAVIPKVESKMSLKLNAITSLNQLNVPPLVQRSTEDVSAPNKRSEENAGISKPTLFQAELLDNSTWQWKAMGVYDDQDLDEHGIFLLICQSEHNFLWIGKQFEFADDCTILSDDRISRWTSTVHRGDVPIDSMLEYKLFVNRSGEETDDFWDAFNEGY